MLPGLEAVIKLIVPPTHIEVSPVTLALGGETATISLQIFDCEGIPSLTTNRILYLPGKLYEKAGGFWRLEDGIDEFVQLAKLNLEIVLLLTFITNAYKASPILNNSDM